MSADILPQLLGLLAVAGCGFAAARLNLLGGPGASRVLSAAAFSVFGPALLFRTAVNTELASMPRTLLLAYFAPMLLLMAVTRRTLHRRPRPPAAPTTVAMALGFGNTVQVGIPVAATLYGEEGLQLHLTLVSVHALLLLGTATCWAEFDIARAAVRDTGAPASWRGWWAVLQRTARQAVVHPVVLPVLLGFAWNVAGLPVPGLMDATLKLLGQAVVPLCLLLIGVSLAEFNLRGTLGRTLWLVALKLLVVPLWVGGVASAVFGLSGLPLAIVVMFAALPVGSNALLFAQRYDTMVAEVTAAVVLSTVGFVFTLPLCLWLLARLAA